MKRVLVTGAEGLVGYATVAELAKSGRPVRALVRKAADIATLQAAFPGLVEIREGDLANSSLVLSAVEGVDSVIHCAALTDISAPFEQLEYVNVQLTLALARAAQNAGVRRFLHISSASVYKKTRGRVDESSSLQPKTPYERSKAQAEAGLIALHKQARRSLSGSMDLVILRPSMIYGARARTMGAKLFAYVPVVNTLFGSVPQFKGGARFNWIHVEDVARAGAFLLNCPEAAGQIFNVAEESCHSIGDVVTTMSDCYGYRRGSTVKINRFTISLLQRLVSKIPFFTRLLSTAAEAAWGEIQFSQSLRAAIDPKLDAEFFDYLGVNFEVDSTKLRSLGFELKHKDLLDELPEVLGWYQQQRWVPQSEDTDNHRRSAPKVGFQFDEIMTGKWTPHQEPARPLQFSISSKTPDIAEFLSSGKMTSRGWIHVDGLANHQPCEGTLLMPIRTRFVHIDLEFAGDEGEKYRLVAMKKLTPVNFIKDITTFLGHVYRKDGSEVGSVVVKFNLKEDALKLVKSIRFTELTEKNHGWLPGPDSQEKILGFTAKW